MLAVPKDVFEVSLGLPLTPSRPLSLRAFAGLSEPGLI